MTDPLGRLRDALADRYRLDRQVGAGGMATVYLAEDLKHRRKVALKVLRPELAASLGPARFVREIEIAAQLQHPHILPLLDSGEVEGFVYYVMPFVDGMSLRERLQKEGELPLTDAVRLVRDVADALSYAHQHGVVHRDIKPENVMLSGRHALVTDFGVAKAVSDAADAGGTTGLTTTGMALGTPAYMSPEQASADPGVDHRADLYSLGAMAYELVTGRPPFVFPTPQQLLAAHVTREPEPVGRQRPGLPPALEQVIMRCLAKRPADRWQSADEVVAQLESIGGLSGGMTPTQTRPVAAVVRGHWYGHPVRVAAIFAAVAAALLGLVWLLGRVVGLPGWVLPASAGLLALGLPIMLATGLVERRRAKLQATGTWRASQETALQGAFTWRRSVLGGATALGLLALATVAWLVLRSLGIGPAGTLVASGKLGERDRLVIADFDNRTADTTLGASLTEALRIDLAQTPIVTVMTGASIAEALRRMQRDPAKGLDAATAQELAQREGAKAILTGEVSPLGASYVLSARLVSAADRTELVALRETAKDATELLGAVDRLSKALRERIGESLRSVRTAEPLQQVTTTSLDALRLYSEAERESNIGSVDRSVPLLEQAVAADSGFAMAWRKLSVALFNLRQNPRRAVTAATRAYALRDRLPELEQAITTAWYFKVADYQPQRTIQAYRRVLELQPDNYIALNNLAVALEDQGDGAAAESLFVRASSVNRSSTHYIGRIRTELALGRLAAARASLDTFQQRVPGTPMLLQMRAAIQYAAGARDSARQSWEALAAPGQPVSLRSWGLGAQGNLAMLEGRLADGERLYEASAAVQRERGDAGVELTQQIAMAWADAMTRGRPELARQVVRQALQRTPLATLDPLDRPYLGLAQVFALTGDPAEARRLVKEYEAAVPEELRRSDEGRYVTAGWIAFAERRWADALAEFRRPELAPGCPRCTHEAEFMIQAAAGQPDSALRAYEQVLAATPSVFSLGAEANALPGIHRRAGELYESRGDRQKALDAYGRFVDLWRKADQELQPQVREVKERMAKLAGEPAR